MNPCDINLPIVVIHYLLHTYNSVRGMQYRLDMNVNAKKPDDLVHLLPYECDRIWPLVLWP